MNQPHPPVAAIDPQRARVPLLLSHYTLPTPYRRIKELVEKEQYVPVPLSIVNAYYNERYGDEFVTHWRAHVGPDIYAHGIFRVHSMMARDLEEIKRADQMSARHLVPLPSMMAIKLFQAAISFQDPLSIQVVWECYRHYLNAVRKIPDLHHMGELLYEPFAMLEADKHRLTPAVLGNYHKLLQFALSRQTLPADAMTIALHEYGEEKAATLALNFEGMPLPDRPKLDDADSPRTPKASSEEPEEILEFTAEVIDPEDYLDEYIDHADGSKGLSTRKQLQQLFVPQVEYIEDPQAMYDVVSKAHKGVWLKAMELWWKTMRPRSSPKAEAHGAWVLDATMRFLEHAYTEEQFSILTEVLPAEEIVDWCQRFILGAAGKEPDNSWQQIRISIISIPLARMAKITETPVIDFAVELYEAAGLHDEIGLLRVTLEIMSETLDEQLVPLSGSIQQSITASRH
jgi:hypothetical protein